MFASLHNVVIAVCTEQYAGSRACTSQVRLTYTPYSQLNAVQTTTFNLIFIYKLFQLLAIMDEKSQI